KTRTCDTALDLLERRFRRKHIIRRRGLFETTAAHVLELEERSGLADLYLLKSGLPQALELAHALEERGAKIINSATASLHCEDRMLLNRTLKQAHFPCPSTYSVPDLKNLLADYDDHRKGWSLRGEDSYSF